MALWRRAGNTRSLLARYQNPGFRSGSEGYGSNRSINHDINGINLLQPPELGNLRYYINLTHPVSHLTILIVSTSFQNVIYIYSC